MRILLTLFATLCLLSSYALNADNTLAAGEKRKMDVLVLSTMIEKDVDMWVYSPSGSNPPIPTRNRILRGQRMMPLVFFKDYAVNKEGIVDISYNLQVTTPDGKELLDPKTRTGIRQSWQAEGSLILAGQRARIRFDNEDPDGIYTISVTAIDHVAGTSAQHSTKFKLISVGETNALKTYDDYQDWVYNYYQKTQPEYIPEALFKHARLEDSNGNLSIPTFWAFKFLLEENDLLKEYIYSRFMQKEEQGKMKIIILRSMLGDEPVEESLLDSKLRDFQNHVRGLELPNPYGEPSEPYQIDMLLAEFYVTGKIKPIRQILRYLQLAEFRGAFDAYADSERTPQDKFQARMDHLFHIALGSIQVKSVQHPLIARYIVFALKRDGKMTQWEKIWIAHVMNQSLPDTFAVVEDLKDPNKAIIEQLKKVNWQLLDNQHKGFN